MSAGNGRSRGPFGPMQQADDVQREIVDAALRVASELSALAGGLGGSTSPGVGANGDGRRRPAPVDFGSLRATVGKSMDLAVDALQALVDSSLDAVERFTTDDRLHHDVSPGGTLTMPWTGGSTPLLPPLHRSDGEALLVRCALDDGRLVLRFPDDARSGTFHGVLLDDSAPDEAVLFTVEVRAESA